MKRSSLTLVFILVFSLFLCGCNQQQAQTEELATTEEVADSLIEDPYPFRDFPAESSSQTPLTPAAPTKLKTELFQAKFEGDEVEGTGEALDNSYHFVATQTDGEAWHVKLEANYPTVAYRDYLVTYRFTSNVAGKIKFGDFQEFDIQEGENTVEGRFTATESSSYLDLQLGMLPAFTIDFTEIQVKEYADKVNYENALPQPIDFTRESRVYESHDAGYAPILVRGDEVVNVNFAASPIDGGVWQSRLFVRTGVVPEPGVHYRVSADIMCDEDMEFELLCNDGNVEKGYGAMYGQKLSANEVRSVEAVIKGNGNPDELILQFSLGNAPDGSQVIIGNVHVDEVIDRYKSMLARDFALDVRTATGVMLEELVPVAFRNIANTGFSYTSLDNIYERHDDGYETELNEFEDGATFAITRAPQNIEDRGVWKAKLYVDTGVSLQPGKSYRVKFDLESAGDQAEYEVCFDGDAENAYGALYGRSLTAGGTDHVEMLITPNANHGPLVLRLQLGKTNSPFGNTVTLRNMSFESADTSYTNVLPASFSYETGTGQPPVEKLTSVLPQSFSYNSTVNVREQHDSGYTQELSSDGSSATLNITAAPAERNVWNSKLLIDTGVTPEANKKYIIRYKVAATAEQPNFEAFADGDYEKAYGEAYGLSLAAGEEKTITHVFNEDASHGPITLRLQLGKTASTSGNTIRVSNIEVVPVSTKLGNNITPASFAYPVSTEATSQTIPAGYVAQETSVSAQAVAWDGSEATASVEAGTAKLEVTKRHTVATEESRIWVTRLEVGTGVVLEKGAKYHISGVLSSQKDLDFEILCSNGAGTEEGDNNPGGMGYSSTVTHGSASENNAKIIDITIDSVPERTEYKELFLRIQAGNGPAPNTITLSNLKVEKWVPEHDELIPGTLTKNSFDFWAHDDYNAFMGGNGSSASVTFNAVANPEAWKTKLFALTAVPLAPGNSYRVTTQLRANQALNYEICYNNGNVEKGFGALYGLSATTLSTPVVFDISPTDVGNLNLQFSLGNAQAGTVATANNIKIETLIEEEGENLMSDKLVAWAPVHAFLDAGYAASLTNTASSASLNLSSVASDQSDWKTKFFVETGAQLKAGKRYRICYDLAADRAFTYHVFYNNGTEEGFDLKSGAKAQFWNLSAGAKQSVQHTVTPASDVNLNMQFMLGLTPAPNTVTISNVQVYEVKTKGDVPDTPPINCWVHEEYKANLSHNSSSASMNITQVPAEGREPWKIKLFAETGAILEAGSTYRVSAQIKGTAEQSFDLCFNNREHEAALGALWGQTLNTNTQNISYNITPTSTAVLFLQCNLGAAASKNKVTISGIKVEKINLNNIANAIPSFRYDSVGYFSRMVDIKYATSLVRHNDSVDFHINQAPASTDDRKPWNARLNVHTGVTPRDGQGYCVSFDVDALWGQDLFEVFYDGDEELAYDAQYEQVLHPGTNSFTYYIYPGESKGELTVQLRFGQTNSTAGNHYTIRNFRVREADFALEYRPEIKDTAELDVQEQFGYSAELSKTAKRAEVRIVNTPSEEVEAWKTKLFIYPNALLSAGGKYRVRLKVSSIVPAPFEVCFNKGHEEKGVGGIFGLLSKPYGEYVEYTVYAKEDGPLVLQLSLGNVPAPNTMVVEDIKVEKADEIMLVSDTSYSF